MKTTTDMQLVPISKLVPADLLNAIRPVEAAGHSVTAHKLAETAGQISGGGCQMNNDSYACENSDKRNQFAYPYSELFILQ